MKLSESSPLLLSFPHCASQQLRDFVFGYLIHPGIGFFLGFLTFLLTMVVNGAARNVFLTAAYEHTQGNTPDAFDAETLDGIFMPK